MLSSYFKPTPKKLLKISLALRAMIGTISGAAYFQGNTNAAFWALVAGAAIEFTIQCIDPKSFKEQISSAKSLLVFLALTSLLAGCKTTKTTSNSSYEKKDSTWTEYKPVDVKVKGASVSASINTDSAKKAFNDSFIIVPGPAHAKATNKPVVVTDPETKVQLKYWYDEFGKLNMECSSKDQTIQMLVAEINRISKEKKTVTVERVINKKPFLYFFSSAVNILLLISLIIYFIGEWRRTR